MATFMSFIDGAATEIYNPLISSPPQNLREIQSTKG